METSYQFRRLANTVAGVLPDSYTQSRNDTFEMLFINEEGDVTVGLQLIETPSDSYIEVDWYKGGTICDSHIIYINSRPEGEVTAELREFIGEELPSEYYQQV